MRGRLISPQGSSFSGSGQALKLEPVQLTDYRNKGLLNSENKPRLYYARSYFLNDFEDIYNFDGLIKFFESWRDYPEYVVLEKVTLINNEETRKRIAIKCSKRGNDVYIYRTKKKIKKVVEALNTAIDFHIENRRYYTNCLFVTLTWGDWLPVKDSWKVISRYYNSFITNLRKHFGKIMAYRTYEAFQSGHPHLHLILVFQEQKFEVFKYKGKWRLRNRKILYEIKKKWNYYVDVQGVGGSHKGLISYIEKTVDYLQPVDDSTLDPEKAKQRLLTLVMTWLFRKRCFSISKNLLDLIADKRNSNSLKQSGLFGDAKILTFWSFIGIMTPSELSIDETKWFVELES